MVGFCAMAHGCRLGSAASMSVVLQVKERGQRVDLTPVRDPLQTWPIAGDRNAAIAGPCSSDTLVIIAEELPIKRRELLAVIGRWLLEANFQEAQGFSDDPLTKSLAREIEQPATVAAQW